MRFRCLAGELSGALALSKPLLAGPWAPPGVLISAGDGVIVTCDDAEVAVIAVSVEAEVGDRGEVSVPAGPLTRYLDALPPACEIEVRLDRDGRLMAQAVGGGAPYRFLVLDGHVAIPAIQDPVVVPADLGDLARAYHCVRPAVPRDGGGVQMVSDGSGLELRATDNYRLHVARLEGHGFGEFSGVVYGQVLDRIARLAPTTAHVDPAGRAVMFTGVRGSLSCRMLGVPFPAADNIVALRDNPGIQVDRDALVVSLRRLASVAGDASAQLTHDRGANELVVAGGDPAMGDGVETVPLESAVETIPAVSVSLAYLADAVGACGPLVRLSHAGDASPVLVTSESPGLAVTVALAPIRH